MRKVLALALAALSIHAAAAAAQTSKYGAPSWHVPYAGSIILPNSTVGQLPLCDGFHVGTLRVVIDAAASPVYNATATGGGTIKLLVVCNGTNWVNQ